MHNGQTVYLAFATPAARDGTPMALVREATVIDPDNRVVRSNSGVITVLEDWKSETVHTTEAEAWAWCHGTLVAAAEEITEKARECAAKAAAARIVAVPA